MGPHKFLFNLTFPTALTRRNNKIVSTTNKHWHVGIYIIYTYIYTCKVSFMSGSLSQNSHNESARSALGKITRGKLSLAKPKGLQNKEKIYPSYQKNIEIKLVQGNLLDISKACLSLLLWKSPFEPFITEFFLSCTARQREHGRIWE